MSNESSDKSIDKMSVEDIVSMDLFRQNLQDVMDEVSDLRKKALKQERRAKRMPIDWFKADGKWDTLHITRWFVEVVKGTSTMNAIERSYIKQLGTIAGKRTIRQIQDASTEEGSNRAD